MMIRERRLTSLDHFFLAAEHENAPMHIGAMLVFEQGALARGEGRVDVGRIRAHVESRLHRTPRYRQRLARTPLEGRAFWADDDRFDLDRHVHYLHLDGGGGEASAREAAAEILSRPLDRERPLWELWVLDGFDADHFALVSKVHHCMADGIGGVEQLMALLDPSPDDPEETAPPWVPEDAPDELDLAVDEMASIVQDAGYRLGHFGQALWHPWSSWSSVGRSVSALGAAVTASLRPSCQTPLNFPLGPGRHFGSLAMPFESLRLVKDRLGGTINDVVLATVAGGLGRYLARRGVVIGDGHVRAAVPVSMRDPASTAANQVSIWFVPLPWNEPDAATRLDAVRVETARLRTEGNAQGLYDVVGLLDGVSPAVLGVGVRLLERIFPFNLIVTNVPGPQFPLYFRGARLVAGFPCVPLFENQGLGIALLSYDGKLYWGFNADPEQVPDLEELVGAVEESFGELLERVSEAPAADVPVPEERAPHPVEAGTPLHWCPEQSIETLRVASPPRLDGWRPAAAAPPRREVNTPVQRR